MAAASCVQEDKDDKEISEHSDTISQGILLFYRHVLLILYLIQHCKAVKGDVKHFRMQPESVHIGGYIVIKQLKVVIYLISKIVIYL